MERFDVVLVGAGPAGSATAHHLATAGAGVLLLDRARFPRDKPCGGGLTGRAVKLLPCPVDAVVEDRATRVLIRARYRGGFERESAEPLVLLTQRRRLDTFLAERAAEAGAEFRDGVRVTAVDGTVVTVAGAAKVRADVLIGADGANGIVARARGLATEIEHGVALEGNAQMERRYRGRLVLEFGNVPGGYGWVFPKDDHLNVGVGGSTAEGPRLRDYLRRLCDAHGFDPTSITDLRGYRLPTRRPEAVLARGRTAVIGDAAGLVDPFSGDGIYEALLSAKLCTVAALDVLDGRTDTLEPYDRAVTRALARTHARGWRLKRALDRSPRLALAVVRIPSIWPLVEAVVQGETPDTTKARVPIRLLRALAH